MLVTPTYIVGNSNKFQDVSSSFSISYLKIDLGF